MHLRNGSLLAAAVALTASALLTAPAAAYNTYTLTFQQGVNGYSGEVDRVFASSTDNSAGRGDTPGGTGPNGSGKVAADGYDGKGSADAQVFLRFNNIIGAGAGQIPTGAFVLDASLTVKTGPSTSADDQTGGPFGVGAVLVDWNTTTSTYNTLKPAGSPENGLSYITGATNNVITRAVGFYDEPAVYGGNNTIDVNEVVTANVASLVRNWASGSAQNYGFTIHAGAPAATTNGWGIQAGTTSASGSRPKLSVTYTNAPVQTATFQQGVNGYSGTTMSQLPDRGAPTDGSSVDHAFLDGWDPAPTEDGVSPDTRALIKFNNIFTSQGGSVPDHAVIVKAYLKVTTSDVSNAQTGQPYEVHQMLTDWGTDTRYTDFSGDGPVAGVHETTDFSYNYGMIPGSNAYFDITQAVNGWQSGQSNYGLDLRAALDPNDPVNTTGTTDGWSIYFTGADDASVRPELVVSYFVHLPGDANDNGKIDADDFALIDRGFRKQPGSPQWSDGDFNYDGQITNADYLLLDSAWASQGGHPLDPAFLAAREAQFGADYAAALIAAVPEPTSLGLLACAALPFLSRRRRTAAN